MKNVVKNLLLASAPLLLLMGDAVAEQCGGRFGACPLPEPGTPYLIVAAIGAAGLIIKFRKKK